MSGVAPREDSGLRALARWVLSDRRVLALATALGANLVVNVGNVVPFVGPIVEAFADVGFETIALLIAMSILRRDKKPLKALLVLGGIGVLKIALDGLNLLPEVGSVLDFVGELGLDLTQLFFLKEVLKSPEPSRRPIIDVPGEVVS